MLRKLRGLPAKMLRLARSLRAGQAQPDDRWAEARLTAPEVRLYRRMDPRDREHALRVTRHLLRGHPNAAPELLAAALLHDSGKSVRPYRVWERVLVGLVPYSLAVRLPGAALQVRARHPQLGAHLLRELGGREVVAQLIELHHAPGDDAAAQLLHHYDDRE